MQAGTNTTEYRNGLAPAGKNRKRPALAAALLVTTALSGLGALIAAPALAQTIAQTDAGFSIPAQSLSSALVQFSSQSGLELFVNADLVRGKSSPGVAGQIGDAEALNQLLSGSGLSYSLSGNSVTISDPSAEAVVYDGSIVLETIDVNAWMESAFGPVDGIAAQTSATGTKTQAELLDLSSSVSVVGQNEMTQRGVTSLDGVLDYTSGVNTNHYGGDKRYDFVAVRGFTETTGGIYRDGMTNRQSGAFTNSRVEPYGMERVEVLKGGTSTLYGLNSPGGMVNMVTKRPLDYQHGEVYTTVGDGHLETGADFGGPLADGQLSYRLTGKWQDGQDGWDFANDDRFYIAPAITLTPSEMTSLTILADYNQREGANRYGIPMGSGLDPDTFLGEEQFNQNDTTEWNFGWILDHDFGNGLKVHQNARYNNLTLVNKNTYLQPGQGMGEARRTVMEVDGERERFSIDTNLQYDASFDWVDSTTLLGADMSQSTFAETDKRGLIPGIGSITNPVYCTPNCTITPSVPLAPSPYSIDGEDRTFGLYLQEELTFDDRFIVTLGGRYDWVEGKANGTFDMFPLFPGMMVYNDSVAVAEEAFTKRAGLTWKATEEVSVYGNYAESYMPVMPSPNPFGGGGATPRLVPQKPIMGETWEAGVKYQPDGMNALFSAAVFDITQSNVPRASFDGRTVEQIGEVKTRGLELEAKAAVTEDMNLTFAYTYLDNEITKGRTPVEEGKRLPFIPEYMASAWVDYTFRGQGNLGDLTVGLGGRLVGPRFAEENNVNNTKMDPYVVFDASLNYQISDNASLSVSATNLLDTKYVSYIEPYSDPETEIYGDGRAVKATVKWTW